MWMFYLCTGAIGLAAVVVLINAAIAGRRAEARITKLIADLERREVMERAEAIRRYEELHEEKNWYSRRC